MSDDSLETPDNWLTCPLCDDVVIVETLPNNRKLAWCTKCGLELEGNIDVASIITLWKRMLVEAEDKP